MSETLRQRLMRHEGLRLSLYHDHLGFATIGYGRCLAKRGISEAEAEFMLDNDIEECKNEVTKALPWVMDLDPARREVLYEMCFQLGLKGLLGFRNTLEAIRLGHWAVAKQGMLNSLWHRQTPNRCEELADIILTGKDSL